MPQMYINKDILSFCVVNMADFCAFKFLHFFFQMCNHRQPKSKIIKVKGQALIRDVGIELASWILKEDRRISRDSRRQLESKRMASESLSLSSIYENRLPPLRMSTPHRWDEFSDKFFSISEQFFYYSLIMHERSTNQSSQFVPRAVLWNSV